MTIETVSAAFEYASLDTETRIVVQQRTTEIRAIARRTASDVIEIGQKLIEVKERLGHGQFGKWLETEFAWSEPSAQRFMRVAEYFQNRQIDGFAPSALYMLAAPSVSQEARDEAIQRAETGQPVTIAAAKVIIAENTVAQVGKQYATMEQLETGIRSWLPTYSRDRRTQLATLSDIRSNPSSGAGQSALAKLMESPAITKPFRVQDLVTACSHVFNELTAPPPPALAPAVAYTPPATSARSRPADDDTEPQADPVDLDLPAVVIRWLEDQVTNLALADETEARIWCLEQIVKARNGFGSPSATASWKDLRYYDGWPTGTDVDAKGEAVRVALALLKGEDAEPAAVVLPAARPAPSWAGVKPVAGGGNGHKPTPTRGTDEFAVMVDHLARFVQAALAVRTWAQKHPALIEEDGELCRALEALDDARIRALCTD